MVEFQHSPFDSNGVMVAARLCECSVTLHSKAYPSENHESKPFSLKNLIDFDITAYHLAMI